MRRKSFRQAATAAGVTLLLVPFAAGCGRVGNAEDELGRASENYAFALVDHQHAVRPDFQDVLFDLDVTRASAALPTSDLRVTLLRAGHQAITLSHELSTDADGDGRIGQRDVVTVREASVGQLTDADVGHAVTIQVAIRRPEQGAEHFETAGTYTWTP